MILGAFLIVTVCMNAHSAPLDTGLAALKSGHYAEALKILLPLANDGNAQAQRVVGEMCYQGQGMKPDKTAAFKWNELAADSGDMLAQYNMGYLYERGEGTAASSNDAIRFYTKAGLQGYVPAQIKLGDLYVATSRGNALYWYRSAMELGNDEARQKYSVLSSASVKEFREQLARDEAEKEVKQREEDRTEKVRLARLDAERAAPDNDSDTPSVSPSWVDSTRSVLEIGRQNPQRTFSRPAQVNPPRTVAGQEVRVSAPATVIVAADNTEREEAERKRKIAEQRAKEVQAVDEQRRLAAKEKESLDREEAVKKTAYLNAMMSGIKLSARSCPDGEGKHYIVGLRPKIKPEVVECIDVGYAESCPGSAASSAGTVSNFIGVATDCFMGDAATVAPTPACNPKVATVKVTRVAACGGLASSANFCLFLIM